MSILRLVTSAERLEDGRNRVTLSCGHYVRLRTRRVLVGTYRPCETCERKKPGLLEDFEGDEK